MQLSFCLETCRREALGHWCAVHTCVLRSPLFFSQRGPTAFSNLECLQHFARTQWRGQVSVLTSSRRRLWLALGIQEAGERAAGSRRNLLEVFGWYCPFLLVRPAGQPSRRRMRSSCVLLTALVALAAYYIYIPLPSSVSDPWKLMLLDATFRSAQQVVRRSPGLILSPFSWAIFKGERISGLVPWDAYFCSAIRLLLFKVIQADIFRMSHSLLG